MATLQVDRPETGITRITLKVPGACTMLLYQPRHPTAYGR